jgi:hypothetical protein
MAKKQERILNKMAICGRWEMKHLSPSSGTDMTFRIRKRKNWSKGQKHA